MLKKKEGEAHRPMGLFGYYKGRGDITAADIYKKEARVILWQAAHADTPLVFILRE